MLVPKHKLDIALIRTIVHIYKPVSAAYSTPVLDFYKRIL